MSAEDMVEVLRLFAGQGIEVWVDGGWGVDALLGEQTRPHGDLDIAMHHADVPRLRALLEARGHGHEVDVHAMEYPAGSLTGHGSIGSDPVRCVSPEWLVKFHSGDTLDETDYRDVLALCRRFGIELPAEYRAFVPKRAEP